MGGRFFTEQARRCPVMSDMARLIIVDDEPELRRMAAEYLSGHGFKVRTASGGRELDAQLAAEPADLLILDVAMPGEDGFSIARRLRAGSGVPILMLTAAEELVERVVGLELGADDYLTKPFDLRELRARIRAILRRRTAGEPPAAAASAPVPAGSTVRFGRTRLDLEGCQLLRDDGTVLALTAMEFDLLKAFAENPNRVLTRDRLLTLAHNGDGEPFDRSIDSRIARLRRKIEDEPARPTVLTTIRGEGYVFVARKE
jgi:two-component system OmpR family response regulator